MERRTFIRNSMLTVGGALLSGSVIFRLLKTEHEHNDHMPAKIEKVSEGDGKKIMVLMSAGTRQGNTDRLTDAFIKGMAEKGHSVTKVYLGSMHIAGCRGCGPTVHRNNSLVRHF